MNPIPKLSKEDLRSALIGMILGDSHIGFSERSKNARLTLDHSPKQAKYMEYCSDIISQIPNIHINIKKRLRRIKEKTYGIISLNTNNSPIFTRLYRQMYKNKKAIVTKKQLNKLTPLGLAIWFQDDGSACFRYRNNKTVISNRAIKICTMAYSYEEHLIMQKYFWERWGIKVKIYKDKGKYYLWFQGKEANKFINIIAPYVIPENHYKINLRYSKPRLNILVGEVEKPITPTRESDTTFISSKDIV